MVMKLLILLALVGIVSCKDEKTAEEPSCPKIEFNSKTLSAITKCKKDNEVVKAKGFITDENNKDKRDERCQNAQLIKSCIRRKINEDGCKKEEISNFWNEGRVSFFMNSLMQLRFDSTSCAEVAKEDCPKGMFAPNMYNAINDCKPKKRRAIRNILNGTEVCKYVSKFAKCVRIRLEEKCTKTSVNDSWDEARVVQQVQSQIGVNFTDIVKCNLAHYVCNKREESKPKEQYPEGSEQNPIVIDKREETPKYGDYDCPKTKLSQFVSWYGVRDCKKDLGQPKQDNVCGFLKELRKCAKKKIMERCTQQSFDAFWDEDQAARDTDDESGISYADVENCNSKDSKTGNKREESQGNKGEESKPKEQYPEGSEQNPIVIDKREETPKYGDNDCPKPKFSQFLMEGIPDCKKDLGKPKEDNVCGFLKELRKCAKKKLMERCTQQSFDAFWDEDQAAWITDDISYAEVCKSKDSKTDKE